MDADLDSHPHHWNQYHDYCAAVVNRKGLPLLLRCENHHGPLGSAVGDFRRKTCCMSCNQHLDVDSTLS